MIDAPRVSILITTYNRPDVLRRAIKSVLVQDFGDYELVIIDDCSTDHTQDVISEYPDPRIRNLRNEENVGAVLGDRAHKQRFVYELMRGEYFVNFCDDDFWLQPDLLSRQIGAFAEHDNLAMVIGGQLTVFLDDDEPMPHLDRFNLGDFIDPESLRSRHPKVHMQDAPLKDGFMTSEEYLELFSRHPGACNINGGASLMSRRHFAAAGALADSKGSLWQAGYEWFLGAACFGNVVYLNSPELVVEARPKNASFQWTQAAHYADAVHSAELAFARPLQAEALRASWPMIQEKRCKLLQNLSRDFLRNTERIKRDGRLGLCSEENMRVPVSAPQVLKVFLRNDIFPRGSDLGMMLRASVPPVCYKIGRRLARLC